MTSYRPNPRALLAAARWKAKKDAEAADAAVKAAEERLAQQEHEEQLYKVAMVLLSARQGIRFTRDRARK